MPRRGGVRKGAAPERDVPRESGAPRGNPGGGLSYFTLLHYLHYSEGSAALLVLTMPVSLSVRDVPPGVTSEDFGGIFGQLEGYLDSRYDASSNAGSVTFANEDLAWMARSVYSGWRGWGTGSKSRPTRDVCRAR